MITDLDGKARANYTMYGQFPQSHGSTPSISVTTEKSPRTSYIDTTGRVGLASYAQFFMVHSTFFIYQCRIFYAYIH